MSIDKIANLLNYNIIINRGPIERPSAANMSNLQCLSEYLYTVTGEMIKTNKLFHFYIGAGK